MKKIQGREIKGFRHADGVHWYWGDREVAVINELQREIEWCDRTFKFPKEVVDEVRSKMPTAGGKWIIEARRTQVSTTQRRISIFVNNKDMDMHFKDDVTLNGNGQWESTTPDDELGRFVYACLWNPMDNVYHYSDRFKDLFNSDWRKNDESSKY